MMSFLMMHCICKKDRRCFNCGTLFKFKGRNCPTAVCPVSLPLYYEHYPGPAFVQCPLTRVPSPPVGKNA